MSRGRRILALGPGEGWHADRLRQAAERRGDALCWARYESLAATFDDRGRHDVTCEVGLDGPIVSLADFDAVLARTMPTGSLEQITLRLSTLHNWAEQGHPVTNPPQTLEWAIDKYRTLARVAALGYAVPETHVVQSRREAMRAFDLLGGDVVVKPIFGGEGRGVMRVTDRELAWFTFATLEQIDAALYVQKFIRPGGVDTRLLVIGDDIFSVRRFAIDGWKTNISQGGRCERSTLTAGEAELARRIADDFGLRIGSVDLIDCEGEPPKVLEVNAVPGWKGAEMALGVDLAERMLAALP